MVFQPFEDEVGLVDCWTSVWDQDWKFLEGIIVFCLGCAVPRDFGLEGEWDSFFGQGDADFAGVWRTTKRELGEFEGGDNGMEECMGGWDSSAVLKFL